ncbi:unnamed protein product [Rotaria sordida]|uniref:Sodium/hydrogen exchanger n=1 Tax=Rotaria sordida TaxID=392033 RepID=A0A818GIZ7_9BILA|nr:unnamed protein product [Rotaria sordida]
MAGMKFEYDENGGKFYYFFLSFYALILISTTYWLWPKSEKRKNTPLHPEDTSNIAPCRYKHQLLHANKPNPRRRAILTKKHHPDRGGDPEKFKEIAKAYKTLTDEEAKENWKKYGNPDGPGVTRFDIALPKWLVDHQNSTFVLLIYTGVFMIVLPVIVCVWWQKSARYAGDHILIDTIHLYWVFLSKTSSIIIKRPIMILSVSTEFDRTRNSIIIDRPSDNTELSKLYRELPDIQEKTKERPFQAPYSIKARTLLHAHLHRLDTLSDNLEKDKRYIVRRSIYLINEMINIEAQLVAMGHAGRLKNVPRLDTIENTMKLSAMLVQALLNTKSPLLQLPHITENYLRFFETKKHTIKSIRQFVAMDDEQRRSILHSITDEQYYDIMNVLAIYPHITMNVTYGVFDDEDEHIITTGAVVTLTVHLHRENMSSVFSKEMTTNTFAVANTLDDETNEEHIDDKENRDTTNETLKTSAANLPLNLRRNREQTEEDLDEIDNELNGNNNDNDNDENIINDQTSSNKTKIQHNDNEEDIFLERFQKQQRKREKKHHSLISAPVHLCTLKDDEEIEVKFSAPKIPAHYLYSVILRSDSYFDVDVMENLSLDVQAAKEVVDNHPQWDFSENDERINNKVEDNEFTTEKQTYIHNQAKPPRFHVAEFNFDHVSDVYAITLWILLGSLAKVGFHLSHRLTEKFPESCLLIILGLIVGGLLYITHLAEQKAYVLNSDTFFLFLLPPIILEAGYFMPNRPFFDNLGTILLLAIVNTLFNTICIGLTLWGFSFTPLYGGTQFGMLPCFVFAALISAVDPVAVLATFTEIHVNDMLYIVVFGESLLNDAVSVVLYRMFDSFAKIGQENLIPLDLILGFLSFFVVSLGGVLIGIIFGVVACFTTKFTEHTPVLEPLIILVYAYLAYLTSEMVSVSGILAITFCGMVMKQYVSFNISKKSDATTEYVLKMLSSIMETIIFMFMGLSTVSDHHSWNTGFVLITLLACLVFRVIGIAIFANLANCWRLLELTRIDMLIMSYGGLRGAIAFALALILDETKIPRKKEFVTATIAVVFFTVFLQGITIGPLVKCLNVRRKQIEEPTMSAKLTNRMMDHVMTCLEEISGSGGSNSLRDKCRNLDRNYFKRWLLRETPQEKMDIKLLQTFKKINMQSAMKVHDTSKGLVPTPSSTTIHTSPSGANLRPSSTFANFSQLLAANLPEQTVPDLMFFESQGTEHYHDDAQMHHFLDTNLYRARPRATIHVRSKDEMADTNNETNNRFEKSYHHRNHIYIPPRLDKEQLHGRKTGRSSSGTNRLTGAKAASSTQADHDSRSSKHSLIPSYKRESFKSTNSPKQRQQQQKSKSRSKSPPLSSDQPIKSLSETKDIDQPIPPVSIVIENEDDTVKMDGATAAERICPWRRSSLPDGEKLTSTSSIDDPSNTSHTFSNTNDPNLHSGPLTSANFSGAYNKSAEYMGEFATITKPEEYVSRPHVRDLFNNQFRTSDEKQENNSETASNESVTRL